MKYTLEERKELYELLRLQEKYVACKGACNVMSDYVALLTQFCPVVKSILSDFSRISGI